MTQSRFNAPSTIGAAAAGFAAGLAINIGRKFVVQGMTAAHGSWDEGLKAEHRATMVLFDAIEETGPTDIRKRKTLLVQLQHALSKHAFQEENVVYPAMRDNGLADAADALVHDHGYVKQYLFDLAEMPADNAAWMDKVRKFRAEIEEHVAREEEELFPQLRTALGEAGNKHVTSLMNKAGFAAA